MNRGSSGVYSLLLSLELVRLPYIFCTGGTLNKTNPRKRYEHENSKMPHDRVWILIRKCNEMHKWIYHQIPGSVGNRMSIDIPYECINAISSMLYNPIFSLRFPQQEKPKYFVVISICFEDPTTPHSDKESVWKTHTPSNILPWKETFV